MGGAMDAGAKVNFVHLADFDLPLFSAEAEADTGMPQNARRFKALMMEHDGFLISMPEYNGSVTGAFKNMIDWVSRSGDGNPGKAAFAGKTAAFLSASPGRFGGVRALDHAWYILSHMGVTVIPQNFPLGGAGEIIDGEGHIADDGIRQSAQAIGTALVKAIPPVPAQ